jgi:8-oxo-dGTP pyrophosphatase MutT (NUDIX family)
LLIVDIWCYHRLMIPRLRQELSERKPQRVDAPSRISAAILIPLYCIDNDYYVVFTERTQSVRTHKGQISFPGGSRDETDPSLLETAVRECEEEIGLPRKAIEIVGQLDDCLTMISNYVITPFVGLIPWPHVFETSEMETASVIEVPMADLLDSTALSEGSEIMGDRVVPAYFYTYSNEGKVIWGATARILKQFLEIWEGVAGSLPGK